ncbi:methylthioadenosine phosphorylase [Phytophthora cinnamomi]|uniref:methylthioadenosine phosphorylase n=1 Tax=Phytophthora cinnamomi TaxID=4785 RepID=UPI0035599BD0|nr:methylthioadenosine phosphorylase [Phytophthora cinnamomi]
MISRTHVLGVIGGSSLFHAKSFSANLVEQVVETEFGAVVCHVGAWQPQVSATATTTAEQPQDEVASSLQLVFVQRHHADPDGEYRQPRQINFRAIALALKTLRCEAVVGIYSVGSMTAQIGVGRFVVPEDFFSPFDIMHLSKDYDAHVVPELHPKLQQAIVLALQDGGFHPHDGGVYVQTAGPRFETKSEVRFFAQFGQLIGMTGANEAELLNELRVPFAMFSIVDNLANGIGDPLTLEAFKATQKANADQMERAVVHVLDELTSRKTLAAFAP